MVRFSRNKWKAPLSATAALLAGVLALSACGGSDSDSGSTDAGGSTGSTPKVVRIGLDTKVTTLDPNKLIDASMLTVAHLIYGTLLDLTPDATRVVPDVAASYDTSSDGKTVTFHIRDGLTFSDGTPLTSRDVVASWNYFIHDPASVAAGAAKPIGSVEATDASTVVFHLKTPYPSLPFVVALPNYPILPAGPLARDRRALLRQPISAGPYVLATPLGSNNLVLKRNEKYAGAKPIVPEIDAMTVGDPNARINQLKAGQLDIADALPPTAAKQLGGDTRVKFTPVLGGQYMYMNNHQAPLDDVHVRKAISLAVDRNQISQLAYAGEVKPLLDFWGGPSAHREDLLPAQPDIDAAKAELKGTACEHGCTVKIQLRASDEGDRQADLVVQQNLRAIGINVAIESVDPNVATDREMRGNYVSEVNNLYDYTDIPDNMLVYGLISDGGINALYSGYDSPQMDALAQRAIVSDGDARVEAIRAINRLFVEDMPYVPLTDYPVVSGTRLKGDEVFQGASTLYEAAREK